MLSVYNLLMGYTDTCNSLVGDAERSVGETGGEGAILVFVYGHVVECRTCRFCFMWLQGISVDAGQYLLAFW